MEALAVYRKEAALGGEVPEEVTWEVLEGEIWGAYHKAVACCVEWAAPEEVIWEDYVRESLADPAVPWEAPEVISAGYHKGVVCFSPEAKEGSWEEPWGECVP